MSPSVILGANTRNAQKHKSRAVLKMLETFTPVTKT